jgi:GNAT superfamily N-acetyltransferase
MTIPDAIEIVRVHPASEEAVDLMNELDDELQGRYPGALIQGLQEAETDESRVTFFVARAGHKPVGCAAIRELDQRTGEVKRMYVPDAFRGRGVARLLLTALEASARALGYGTLRLETGDRQPEAIRLYTSGGFEPIAPFGQYVGNPYSRCFEKRLT